MTHALTKPRSTAIQAVGGGRSWWAHRQYTRINTELTILPEKVEDYLHFLESVCLLARFRTFAPPRYVLVVAGGC